MNRMKARQMDGPASMDRRHKSQESTMQRLESFFLFYQPLLYKTSASFNGLFTHANAI